jgi:restriction system protein
VIVVRRGILFGLMELDQEARRGLVWVAFWGVVFLGFLIGGAVAGNATGPLLTLVVLVAVTLQWWSGLRHRIALRAAGLDQVDTMSGIEFEQYIAAVLQGVGYTSVKFTKTTGDFGVDLIASKGTGTTAVQCKRQAQSVGTAAGQQVVAGAAVYGCTATMVVTNQLFTPAAQKLAGIHDVALVDRARLERLAISARHPTKSRPAAKSPTKSYGQSPVSSPTSTQPASPELPLLEGHTRGVALVAALLLALVLVAVVTTIFVGQHRSSPPSAPPSSSPPVELPFTGVHYPQGVAVDTAGDVYVTDSENNRVLKLPAGSNTQVELPFTPKVWR